MKINFKAGLDLLRVCPTSNQQQAQVFMVKIVNKLFLNVSYLQQLNQVKQVSGLNLVNKTLCNKIVSGSVSRSTEPRFEMLLN